MNIYRDGQVKKLCVFLSLCALIFLIWGVGIYQYQGKSVQRIFLEHDRAVVSSLLENGVPKDIIAISITNDIENNKGKEFLVSIGITEKTALKYFSFLSVFQKNVGTFTLLRSVFLIGSFALGISVFFYKREMLYQHAIQTIARFTDGDFSCRLSQKSEGTLYRLLSSVDQLSLMLQSKGEVERSGKEFLKNTISDISHQLRTPLSALLMYHEIMSDEPDNIETIKEYLDKTGTSLQRMEQLIQSMLKITRLDAGSIIFEKRCCLLSDLIGCSVQELTTRAENEGKDIVIVGPSDEAIVCDWEWTCEAVGNIVKNALDHTDNMKGKIQITWEYTPIMVRIFISDNGTGISQQDLHHIFKRFYRSKKSVNIPGIGLGLPLAKSIIEGQGGILSVESRLGEGTTFIISFLTEL